MRGSQFSAITYTLQHRCDMSEKVTIIEIPLPTTATSDCYLSLTDVWVSCQKVAIDFWLGGGFHRVLQFPPLLTTG